MNEEELSGVAGIEQRIKHLVAQAETMEGEEKEKAEAEIAELTKEKEAAESGIATVKADAAKAEGMEEKAKDVLGGLHL